MAKIQALIRGFLDRVFCKKLRREARAVRLLQRIIRGKLGRIRFKIAYWRSLSIVKTDSGLQVDPVTLCNMASMSNEKNHNAL